MRKKTTITIVTPTYNQAEFIAATYESVLAQRDPAYTIEYLVYDALSTDGTDKISARYQKAFTRAGITFVYTREKDRGQSDAINKGWRRASGDILTYLNSDDYYEPGALKQVVDYFTSHPEVGWAYGGYRYVNRYGWLYAAVEPRVFSLARLLDYCPIGQPSCFFRRSLINKVGLLNEGLHLAMDYDLWLRFAAQQPAGIITAVLSNMRYYAGTKSGAKAKQHLDEAFALARAYTKQWSLARLRQWFYYLRGLLVIWARIDITRRVELVTPGDL